MHILLFASNFYPEIGSSSQIYFDLAKTFARHGHDVEVIASYPRKYTLSKEHQSVEFPLEEVIDGVHVHRVKHPSNRDNIIVRGLEHFYLPLYYFKEYKRLKKSGCGKIDACILHTPPLPFYYLTKMVKKYDGTPSILNFEDFHPQELTDVGFLKNPVVIWVMKHIEKQAYKKSDYITVHSPGGIDYVVSRGADPKRVALVYNSVDLEVVDNPDIPGDFKQKNGIEDKFLVTYAGILSPFQGLDRILDAAKAVDDNSNILFYIVGDGMEKEHLEKRVAEENITHARILTFLPRDEYLNLVKSSDVALVSLDKRMHAPCLPGKFLNLMGMKRPILAMVDEKSESARVVRDAECGYVVNPDNLEEIVGAVISLRDDTDGCKRFGENGREFMVNHMTTEVATKKYEDIIKYL